MYDAIILGGGISGLYCAHELLKNKSSAKILLLEKNNYYGGRIYTVHHKDLVFEAGAGRFNNTHTLLLSLLKRLDLESKKMSIPSDLHFVPSTKYVQEYFDANPFDVMSPVISHAKRTNRAILRKKTFIQFASSILKPEQIQFLKDSFGYYQQLVEMNAYDAIQLFDKGMHTKNDFYTLQGGMSQLVEELYKSISKKCICKLNQEVLSIEYNGTCFKVETKNEIYNGLHCIAALPKPALEKLPIFRPIKDMLRSIKVKSLCRIYTQFAKDDIWFKMIPKTTTNNQNRYIIPIDREKGLIMISYTDSKYASYWKNMPEITMTQKIKANIYKTFNFKIADPIYTRVCYWDIGTAFWLPNYNSNQLSKEIMNPYSSCPLYICGENYSTNQGWIEGALETAKKVSEKIKL